MGQRIRSPQAPSQYPRSAPCTCMLTLAISYLTIPSYTRLVRCVAKGQPIATKASVTLLTTMHASLYCAVGRKSYADGSHCWSSGRMQRPRSVEVEARASSCATARSISTTSVLQWSGLFQYSRWTTTLRHHRASRAGSLRGRQLACSKGEVHCHPAAQRQS
jgi:hypothetical protein